MEEFVIVSIVLFIKDSIRAKQEGTGRNKIYIVLFSISMAIIALYSDRNHYYGCTFNLYLLYLPKFFDYTVYSKGVVAVKKITVILATVLLFVAVNTFLYITITSRLANNFSGTGQLKMVDVAKFLPFEEKSELARTGSSLNFENGDDLPVLDGAAALVPVYASVIENCYPEGTVTYEGGAFSDDIYYGENFAPDSVMQYQNTIRGFDALVDGSVDLFLQLTPPKNKCCQHKKRVLKSKSCQ